MADKTWWHDWWNCWYTGYSLAPLSFRGAIYSGVFTLYPLISGKQRAHHGAILRKAAQLIQQGKVILMVDPARYNLETINAAYDTVKQRIAKGKVIDIG